MDKVEVTGYAFTHSFSHPVSGIWAVAAKDRRGSSDVSYEDASYGFAGYSRFYDALCKAGWLDYFEVSGAEEPFNSRIVLKGKGRQEAVDSLRSLKPEDFEVKPDLLNLLWLNKKEPSSLFSKAGSFVGEAVDMLGLRDPDRTLCLIEDYAEDFLMKNGLEVSRENTFKAIELIVLLTSHVNFYYFAARAFSEGSMPLSSLEETVARVIELNVNINFMYVCFVVDCSMSSARLALAYQELWENAPFSWFEQHVRESR